MKKRIFWSIVIMTVLLLLAFFSPQIYWRATGIICGEAFYDGRPSSYWRDVAKAEHTRQPEEVMPVLFVLQNPGPKPWHEKFDEWNEKWRTNPKAEWSKLKIDTNAIPVLRDLISDQDAAIRSVAMKALCRHRTAVRDDLPQLLDFVRSGDDQDARTYVATSLHRIGDAELLPTLCEWLDEDEELSNLALVAIAEYGPKADAAVPKLIKGLGKPNGTKFAETLGRIRAKSLPALAIAMKSDDVVVRRNATSAVAFINDPDREPLLIAQLKDSDARVRRNAVGPLGQLSLDGVYAALRAYNYDPDQSVQEAAIASLDRPVYNRPIGFHPTFHIRAVIEDAKKQMREDVLYEAERALEKYVQAK